MAGVDTLLTPPVATTFEAVSAIASAALYVIVAIAALARAPRDVRVRVFCATALASVAPYSVTALIWARGSRAALTLPVVLTVGLSLAMGSLALFHFTQIFPWRRPWIRAHAKWLFGGYLALPLVTAVAAWPLMSVFSVLSQVPASELGGLGAVSAEGAALVVLLIVMPTLFVLGIVVPFGSLMSLYKTWLTAKSRAVEAARVTTLWILISQMAGGVLAILIVPLLRLVAPTGPWVTIAAVLLFAFGLLMPLAFATGVWTYRVLDLDPEIAPEGL
jgi:hypothetical protein